MKLKLERVLIAIPPEIRNQEERSFLERAFRISTRVGLTSHLISIAPHETLATAPPATEFHPSSRRNFLNDSLSVLRTRRISILILPLIRSIRAEFQELLEKSEVPILLLPANGAPEEENLTSVLVSLSGERRYNLALELGITLANRIRVPLDIVHVSPIYAHPRGRKEPCEGSRVGHVTDEFHHEYPKLVDELVAEASPFSTATERLVIRGFCHCEGEPAKQILHVASEHRNSVLLLEWKGSFRIGHAETIKTILRSSRLPVLLVRQSEHGRAKLKVGEDFEAA